MHNLADKYCMKLRRIHKYIFWFLITSLPAMFVFQNCSSTRILTLFSSGNPSQADSLNDELNAQIYSTLQEVKSTEHSLRGPASVALETEDTNQITEQEITNDKNFKVKLRPRRIKKQK